MKLRLWKLGSLEHKITPSPSAFQRLREILLDVEARQDEISSCDIVWDAAIAVEEIEIGPDGINVVTGDFEFSNEFWEKIEQLIAEEKNTHAQQTVGQVAETEAGDADCLGDDRERGAVESSKMPDRPQYPGLDHTEARYGSTEPPSYWER